MIRHKHGQVTLAFLTLAALVLCACGDRAIYAERSGVNLKLAVNDSASLPVEVNMGLQRAVVAVVPARGEDADGNALGEAGSIVSGFDYRHGQDLALPLQADTTIKTTFLSGQAANDFTALDPDSVSAARDAAGITAKVAAVVEAAQIATLSPAEHAARTDLGAQVLALPEDRRRAFDADFAASFPAYGLSEESEPAEYNDALFDLLTTSGNEQDIAALRIILQAAQS